MITKRPSCVRVQNLSQVYIKTRLQIRVANGAACYSDGNFGYETIVEVKGLRGNTISKQPEIMRWIFFVLSIGVMISIGVFIEKSIISEVVWLLYCGVIASGVLGMMLTAFRFYAHQ